LKAADSFKSEVMYTLHNALIVILQKCI